jgi:hypothetical protein
MLQANNIHRCISKNNQPLLLDEDTLEILEEYHGSHLFSADRHYQRQSALTNSPEAVNIVSDTLDDSLDSSNSLEKLRLRTIIQENSNETTKEARRLLNQWLDHSDSQLQDLKDLDVSKRILMDLKLNRHKKYKDKIKDVYDLQMAKSLVQNVGIDGAREVKYFDSY